MSQLLRYSIKNYVNVLKSPSTNLINQQNMFKVFVGAIVKLALSGISEIKEHNKVAIQLRSPEKLVWQSSRDNIRDVVLFIKVFIKHSVGFYQRCNLNNDDIFSMISLQIVALLFDQYLLNINSQQTNTCSESTIKTVQKDVNMFKVNMKDTRTTSIYHLYI